MVDYITRFESRIIPESNTGCWIWTGTVLNTGYGQFWDGQKKQLAHRFSYRLYKGEIPKNLCIDHLCRNRWCVNPEHMELVTVGENVLRGIGITARNKIKTHCSQGHKYTNKSTHWYKNERVCKNCYVLWNTKAKLEKKGW